MTSSTATWILGEGGLARETVQLLTAIQQAGDRTELAPVRAIGKDDEPDLDEATGALLLGVGEAGLRLRLYERFASTGRFSWPVLVHPRADLGVGNQLDEGAVVTSGCILTCGIRIGAGTLLNLSTTVGHESQLGRGCVVNPGVNISGGVVVGDGVLIGTSATILQNLTIGDGATVGAGAVVTKDVEPGATVVGIPAKPLGR